MNVQNFNPEQSDNCNSSLHQDIYLSGMPNKDISKVEIPCGTELIDGKFIIRQKAGIGRFSDVYRAFDSQRREDIALKIVTLPPLI